MRGGLNDFIIERGVKDGWYYALWKSGWKECSYIYPGGNNNGVNINLPITFSNTDYRVVITCKSSGPTATNGFPGTWAGIYPNTKNQIRLDKQTHEYMYYIKVEGY